MTITDAKDEIKRRIPMTQYLEKSKSGMYCCPFCGSGTGPHKTGAVKVYEDTNTWYCHSCNKSGDVIDLYQNQTGTDFVTAVRDMAGEIGIEVDNASSNQPRENKGDADSSEKPQAVTPNNESSNSNNSSNDYLSYYRACNQRISDKPAVEYLNSRGISVETAQKFGVGFDPQSDPANAPGGQGAIKHPEPRIILPTTLTQYIGRAVRKDIDTKWAKMNSKGSSPSLFNADAMDNTYSPVFVTEGAFDCLSLLELDVSAIALNSASNAERFLGYAKGHPRSSMFILCLDNDSAGHAATEKIKQGLRLQNQPFICANIAGEYKDVNERLQKDREGLVSAVQSALQQCSNKPDNIRVYIDNSLMPDIASFKSDIKTGYLELDEKSGGLYSGLYILAATSSLGKTTFLNQMCDQAAFAGHDVLYFSLEQSRLEMVTKSISRITAQDNSKNANPVSSLSIRKGYLPDNVKDAISKYREWVGDRISIIEGNFNCTASFIGDYIRKYIDANGTKPLVILDYLQIILPEEVNGRMQTTKDAMDSTITSLKRISRDLGIPIIAVSSLNRANYLYPIDFESLKESGSIEYTADVIWGMQLNCITSDDLFSKEGRIKEKREKVKQAKSDSPRLIDLVCLKNRYGISDYRCSFEYYPANDLFVEIDLLPGADDDGDTPKAGRKIGK